MRSMPRALGILKISRVSFKPPLSFMSGPGAHAPDSAAPGRYPSSICLAQRVGFDLRHAPLISQENSCH
jgi:hypothetical protein